MATNKYWQAALDFVTQSDLNDYVRQDELSNFVTTNDFELKQDKLSYYDDNDNEVPIYSVDTEITDDRTTSIPTTQAVYDALQNVSGSSGSSTVNVKYYTIEEIIDQYSIDGTTTQSPIFIDDNGDEWVYEYDDSNSDMYQLWYLNGSNVASETLPTLPLRLKENGEQSVEEALQETNKAVLNRVTTETYNTDKTNLDNRINTNYFAIRGLPVSRSENFATSTIANTEHSITSSIQYPHPTSSDDNPLYIFFAIQNVGIYAKKLTYSDFSTNTGSITWTVNSDVTLKFEYNYSFITNILLTNNISVTACVTLYNSDYADNAIGQAMVDMLYNQYKTE